MEAYEFFLAVKDCLHVYNTHSQRSYAAAPLVAPRLSTTAGVMSLTNIESLGFTLKSENWTLEEETRKKTMLFIDSTAL